MRQPVLQHRDSLWNLLSEVEKAFDVANEPRRDYHPNVELTESEAGFALTFDVPGVPEANIKIEVDQGRLSVSGERPNRGTFSRQFTLPTNVDESAIQARYEHGVLEITVPKSAAARPRAIAINAPKVIEQH